MRLRYPERIALGPGRSSAGAAFLVMLSLLSLTACVHPNRISRGALQQLTRHGQLFVLVFGSLSTSRGTLALPTIRFSRQADRTAPEYLLKSLTITSGDRFYAILQAPREASYTLPYLDEFYIEVGSPNTGFDRINYVRLQQAETPVAIYVGEIQMSPAARRNIQGQAVAVNVRDDFQNATRELKQLYPRFEGTIVKAVVLRNTAAAPVPPRVR
ncbi:MAG TPA: hypothetical protein VG675_09495 [Bryobacteraceae bacterium]|nr:hypothetical protein [Bryobacteraceae bacterium]